MKIGQPAAGIQEQASAAPTAPTAPARTASDEAAKAVADSSAKVELSPTAAGLLTGVQGAPAEFDADKVARIVQALESGTFKVDAEAIADKLIANAREVLGSVKR